jgi:hypothetical protein
MNNPRFSLQHPLRPIPASIRSTAPSCLATLACLVAASAFAQAPTAPAPDYSGESSIIEHLDRVYRYAADGTGSKEITGVVDIRDQAAVKGWSVLSFDFASSAEHVEIDYVRIRRPDGTLVPTPAAATLVRRAVLSCTTHTECQLILIPPADAATQ